MESQPENRKYESGRRFGDEYKSQVIAATNIVELIGRTVSLKKAGRKYTGLCPFHSEKSPSFNVDPTRQFYHCFGCKKSGDVITFVMERDHVGFLDALHQLGDAAGIARPQLSGASKEKTGQRKLLLDANSAAGLFFEKLLADPVIGKAGRAYLQERGFNAESIKNFHIGLSADAWDGLLKSPLMKGFPPAVLATADLVKARESGTGFYDTFRNRLMFPIRDENGRVIAFGGRVMPGSEDPRKYLNSAETPLFSKSRCLFGLDLARQKIVETRTVAIVEGYTDVVMAHQFGATNVVSPLGTALTPGHVQMLRRFADKIVLLFDADSAGDRAANSAVELFLTQPVEIAIASMPDGLDPDEFLLAQGLPAFENVLRNATDALTYKWKQLDRQFNASGNNLTGRQKMVEQFLELLAKARDSGTIEWIRWGQILSQIAKLTDISTEELNRRLKPKKPVRPKLAPRTAPPPAPMRGGETEPGHDSSGHDSSGHDSSGHDSSGDAQPGEVPDVPRRQKKFGPLNARERAERDVLAVLLNEPHRWDGIQHEVTLQQFSDEICRALAELYWQQQRDEGEVVFADFLAGLPDEDLKELAISLVEDADLLLEADLRLKDAIAFFAEEKQRQEQSKHLADLRRSSGSDGNGTGNSTGDATGQKPQATDPDEMLRKLQEKARRPDLRRTGS